MPPFVFAHTIRLSGVRPRLMAAPFVWTYPGVSSLGSDARRGLKDPTVKPTALLEDALLDITNRGDIVIDPCLGSGSTLIAAHNTGRVCRGVERDPLFVDVIVRRYEAATGNRRGDGLSHTRCR
jgi:DNA modification methylase